MAMNLYDILGISRNATSEEIRRAYRRKALETHPDRLPQGASATDKSASEELFRKVNNAYEVLSDPQNRAAYDQHGVWPPPAPAPAPQAPFPNGSSDPFSRDPFFRGPRMDPFSGFGFGSYRGRRGFTDPFVLFDSIFGNFQSAFENDPPFSDPFSRRGSELRPSGNDFFDIGFPFMHSSPFDHSSRGMANDRAQAINGGNGGRWVSESWSSSTVNGVTHTKCVRRDSEGNEHVLYRLPDGTERRTVNGVESSTSQPSRTLPSSAPSAPPVPYSTHPTRTATLPPPTYSEAAGQASHRSRPLRHQSLYNDRPGDRHGHRDRHGYEYPSGDGRGYHDDGHGYGAQNSSSWKFWRS